MVKLCTYVIMKDTGLAPNPYFGWCTLAVCTPNHQGARLSSGDWIAGFLSKKRDNRLLYLMRVDERLHLNDYFRDPRFAAKKPDLRGDWKARCGDNFYSLGRDGVWKQHRNRFHIGKEFLRRDTKKPYAFVGERFWYFGELAPAAGGAFSRLVGGRGVRVNHDPKLVASFIDWVTSKWEEGIHGTPHDNPDLEGHGGRAGCR